MSGSGPNVVPAYGRNNRQNQFFVMLMGHGHQELMREFRLRLDATFESAPPGSRNPSQDYYANQGAGLSSRPGAGTGWRR